MSSYIQRVRKAAITEEINYSLLIVFLGDILSFYGLIPQAVHEVTRKTTGPNKYFDTLVDRFSSVNKSLD